MSHKSARDGIQASEWRWSMEYMIVQAGGKGTRLGSLTRNKPKAMAVVENLPMIFHLFRNYPDKRFIIIADYQKEVLHEYLECFAKVRYLVVDAQGTGTCAGIRQALSLVPEHEPFVLIWSDLILPPDFYLPDGRKDVIGVSDGFSCRWSYIGGRLLEKASVEHGVAGFFVFQNKGRIKDVPGSGEFVQWLSQKQMKLQEVSLAGTREFGTLEDYSRLPKDTCRPFNQLEITAGRVIKKGIDRQGRELAARECRWYEKVKELGFAAVPEIFGTDPLVMERINGKNIYEYEFSYEEKKETLKKLVDTLKKLHQSEQVPIDVFSRKEAYFYKTFARISRVRDLIPYAKEPVICINGRECRNVFFHKRELEKRLDVLPCDDFCLIHGDCTFSNLMLREDGAPILIDPRGYFGYTELYGDDLYDWAKLYYSIAGNYDRFNRKEFCLDIQNNEVFLQVGSNHWEDMEQDFFDMTGADVHAVRLLHAVIWLSLSTYAWQDYDSICGAFYNGLYYLEEEL